MPLPPPPGQLTPPNLDTEPITLFYLTDNACLDRMRHCLEIHQTPLQSRSNILSTGPSWCSPLASYIRNETIVLLRPFIALTRTYVERRAGVTAAIPSSVYRYTNELSNVKYFFLGIKNRSKGRYTTSLEAVHDLSRRTQALVFTAHNSN